jgi:hypothetical protein
MAMADIPDKIIPLLDQYRITEQSIQKLIAPITQCFCRECAGTCCQEEICRESIHSSFLNALVQKQAIAYNDCNGWLADSGCRLRYGRPQVCYAYFCNEVIEAQPKWSQKVNDVIKVFSASGDRASGGTHLIGIESLDELSLHNISKVMNKMDQVGRMISEIN